MRARNEFIAGDWSEAILIGLPTTGRFLEILHTPQAAS